MTQQYRPKTQGKLKVITLAKSRKGENRMRILDLKEQIKQERKRNEENCDQSRKNRADIDYIMMEGDYEPIEEEEENE